MIAVSSLLGILFGLILGAILIKKNSEKKIIEIKCMSDKHLEMFLVMNKWFQNEHKGKTIVNYLNELGVKNISIYGVGYIGKTFYEYLKDKDFEIKYLIDQNNNCNIDGLQVKTIDDDIEEVTDIIIVTAIYYFEEIEDVLKKKFKCPVLSFADIVYKI